MRIIFIVLLFFTFLQADTLSKNIQSYIKKTYIYKDIKKPYKLQILNLKKDTTYAMVETILVYENNSPISTEYIEDLNFILCLKYSNNKWHILY